MSEQAEMKVCKMCGMEIPAKARKCPYCHHWQSRFNMIIGNPVFGVIIFFVPLMLAYGIMMGPIFKRGKDFQPYREQIKVVSSEIKFSDDPNDRRVAIVGRLKNESDYDWKDLILSFEFYDSTGKLTDGRQDMKYSYYIVAHEEGTFKVSSERQFPKESYATCRVKVVYARDGKTLF